MLKTPQRFLFVCAFALCVSLRGADAQPAPAAEVKAAEYVSPYKVRFTHSLSELIGDVIEGRRGDPKEESSVPFSEWYSPEVLKRYHAWGAPAKHFPAPENIESKSADWKRERVLAVALHYTGISYQHHHIPNWNPPADWPWKKVGRGRNEKGIDCSNFSAFVYNLALGIKPTSDIQKQAALTSAPGPGVGAKTKLTRIEKPATYAECANAFKTGDLLFIRKADGEEISHVVIWVGAIGVAKRDVPLIIDSTGSGHKDSNGAEIPDGVHLRAFREKSWYHQSLSHVLRIIHDE